MNNAGFDNRYSEWLERVLKWSLKHGISVKSAVSIISSDSAYNPTGSNDLVTMKDLYWKEVDEFSHKFIKDECKSKLGSEKLIEQVINS